MKKTLNDNQLVINHADVGFDVLITMLKENGEVKFQIEYNEEDLAKSSLTETQLNYIISEYIEESITADVKRLQVENEMKKLSEKDLELIAELYKEQNE